MGSFVFHNRDRFSYNEAFVPADIDIWQKRNDWKQTEKNP